MTCVLCMWHCIGSTSRRCTVLGTESVFFVVGLRHVILYAVVVVIDAGIKDKYLSLTRLMTEKHLLWYRRPAAANPTGGEHAIPEPPDLPPNFDFGHAIDKDTLILWKKLANAIKEEMRTRNIDPTRTGLKPAHDLVPFIVSLWNSVKGGEDVFGRIMKNCDIDWRSLNAFVYFCIRFTKIQIANAHMMYRIIALCQSGVLENAKSYHRLKQRLNEFMSFKKFLRRVSNEWVTPHVISEPNGECPPASDNGGQIQARDGNSVDQVIKIPSRNRLSFFNMPDGQAVRLHGNHNRVSTGDKSLKCLLCKVNTTSRCSRCKVNVCVTKFGSNRKACWEIFHGSIRVRWPDWLRITSV